MELIMNDQIETNNRENSQLVDKQIRQGTIADIPFLAKIVYEASLPPLNHSLWDDLLKRTKTNSLDFLAAMLEADANNWGKLNDFFILEEKGESVAAATGYTPYSQDYRPLCLSRLGEIAKILAWSTQMAREFRLGYEQLWGDESQPAFLKPQASWIIETVAVLPKARGRGLSKILLRKILAAGRQQQHSHAGISVIHGNDIARQTYESLGFKPYQSFYAAYFNELFPDSAYFNDLFAGVTKFRLPLN